MPGLVGAQDSDDSCRVATGLFWRQLSGGTAVAILGAFAAPAIQTRGAMERITVGSIGCSTRGIAIGGQLRTLDVRMT